MYVWWVQSLSAIHWSGGIREVREGGWTPSLETWKYFLNITTETIRKVTEFTYWLSLNGARTDLRDLSHCLYVQFAHIPRIDFALVEKENWVLT